MGQVTIYLDQEHEQRLKQAARAAGLPVSRYVARLVEDKTRNEWPENVRALPGQWADFPSLDELRVSGPDSAGRAVKYALDTTALVRAATLVTHNIGEFQRIPDLHVTDWFE